MTELDQRQLGKTLWNIADTLRGAMNADDFRDYMLSFLFLRYLSDNYEAAAKKELRADYPDPNAIGNGGRTPLWVWYAMLNMELYRARTKLLARSSVSQANINPTTFRKELRISAPSVAEQQQLLLSPEGG
jgi:hypothetical protein